MKILLSLVFIALTFTGCTSGGTEESVTSGIEKIYTVARDGNSQTITGMYFTTGLEDERIIFSPNDESFLDTEDKLITFSNDLAEQYSFFNMTAEDAKSCPDFNGTATVEIQELERINGTYGQSWEAKIVGVNNITPSAVRCYAK